MLASLEQSSEDQPYGKTQKMNLLRASGHFKLLHYVVVSKRMLAKAFLQRYHCGGPTDYTEKCLTFIELYKSALLPLWVCTNVFFNKWFKVDHKTLQRKIFFILKIKMDKFLAEVLLEIIFVTKNFVILKWLQVNKTFCDTLDSFITKKKYCHMPSASALPAADGLCCFVTGYILCLCQCGRCCVWNGAWYKGFEDANIWPEWWSMQAFTSSPPNQLIYRADHHLFCCTAFLDGHQSSLSDETEYFWQMCVWDSSMFVFLLCIWLCV